MHTACAATSMSLTMGCLSRLRSWSPGAISGREGQMAPRWPVAVRKNGLRTPLAMLCELRHAVWHWRGMQRLRLAVCSGARSWIPKVRMRWTCGGFGRQT